MAAPNWVSYVGMVTGISGAIMGYISYRRSGQIKALDLRLELAKDRTGARSLLIACPRYWTMPNDRA